jgi:hypothetical protein
MNFPLRFMEGKVVQTDGDGNLATVRAPGSGFNRQGARSAKLLTHSGLRVGEYVGSARRFLTVVHVEPTVEWNDGANR